VIGFTARLGSARRAEYRRRGYQHLVVIADGMTREVALDLERCLQEVIKTDRRWLIYKRYDPERRDNRHFPSYGAGTTDPASRCHSVYVAWRGDALDAKPTA
jgi:hypothetical protein